MPRPLPALARDARMWASRAWGRSLAPPDWLTVNVTLRCNLSCVMCTTCYDSPELTAREIMDLIDQAADWGVGVFNPLGGEPFVRADLEDILAHAARRDMHTTLTTNATLIRPDRAARIARIPAEKLHINVSLDGAELPHDAVRGPGTFRRAILGYQALRAADEAAGNPRRKICANTILHRKNLATFVDFVGQLRDLGFDGVQVLNLFRNRDDDTVGGLWFEPDDFALLERVCEALTAEELVLNRPEDLRLVPRYYREGLKPLDAPCWAGWKELYVNADGSAIMCDGKLDFLAGRFGSVREATLRQLWQSPELRARREVVKTCSTPCIQNCYLRRESDSLAPLARDAGRLLSQRLGLARPARTLATPLTLELCDIPDDPASPQLQRWIARAPRPYTDLTAAPERLAEWRDLRYLDFGRGFLGPEVASRMLADAASAGFRFAELRLDWRGEPLLHPELASLVRAVAPFADRLRLRTSGLWLHAALVGELRAVPGLIVEAAPERAGAHASLAAQRAARFGIATVEGSKAAEGQLAISWEGRITGSRADVRLAARLGDALKAPSWERWLAQ